MSRLPLSNGEKLKLNTREYVIDEVIGSGATCIVYSAYYIDSFGCNHRVNIKECYPYKAEIERNGQELFWNSNDEKQKNLVLFAEAYKKLMAHQNGNFSVHAFDICERNNTYYIIVDQNEGKTFDLVKETSVKEILNTVKLLSYVVGLYHDNGYLHLDIKPENFLVYSRPSEHIVLFDLDSVTKIEDLENGNVASISYSDKWAAPEQKQKKFSKISKATDIFSIGAVLFEKIMGRTVQCEDMGSFADWDFDDRFKADKMNPCVQRMLKNIFRKTLSANVKKRYQNTEELVLALEKIIDVIASGKPYIVSNYPINTCKFFGREQELEEIEYGLKSTGKVFIYGFGGIGKTELAKQYIKTYKEKYDSIVFIRYDGSIKSELSKITVKGVYDKEDKYGALKEICDDKTLIVLDNFDVATDEDGGLENLLELQCHIIITTRNNEISNLYENTTSVCVADLEIEHLRRIFEEESQTNVGYKEFAKLPILNLFKECTLLLVLFAKLIKAGDYTLDEACKKLKEGLAETDEEEDILNTKDGFRIKQTVAKAMQNLFKLEKFSPEHWEVLHILYHLGCLNLDKRQIKEVASLDKQIPINKKMNAFNDLFERSMIDWKEDLSVLGDEGEGFIIKDVIKDVMDYSFDTSICKVPAVKKFIEQKLVVEKDDILSVEDMDHELEQDIIMNNVICLFKIFATKKHLLDEEIEYFINIAYEMFAGEESLGYYFNNDYSERLVDGILKCAEDENTNAVLRLKAYSLWLVMLCGELRGFKKETRHIKVAKSIKYVLQKAAAIIKDNDIDDENIIDNFCKPIKAKVCGLPYMCELMDVSIIKQIIEWNPLCIRKIETPWRSFEIRALQNFDYEKDYWYGVEEIIEDMEENERESFVYKALGKLLLNGSCVAAQVDDELKDLRLEMFAICSEKYEDVDAVDPLDFAPDSLGMPKIMTIGMGLHNFICSIIEHEQTDVDNISKEVQENIIEMNPESDSYEEKIIEEDFDEFIATLINVQDAEGLYIAIDQFGYLLCLIKERVFATQQLEKRLDLSSVSDNISNEELVQRDLIEELLATSIGELLTETEKDKIEAIVDMFDKKFDDEEIQARFPYCKPWDDYQMYLDDARAEWESLKAPLYCLLDDEENVEKAFDIVLNHSKENIQYFDVDSLINFENRIGFDGFFWPTFNLTDSFDGTDIALPYLVEYTNVVKSFLESKGNFKEKYMYGYYKKIVESSKEYLDKTNEKAILYAIFKDESDEIPSFMKKRKQFSDWYQVYQRKIKEITGLEYNP